MVAYSQTSLAKKLGLKENFKIKIVNQPDYYFKLFDDVPPGIEMLKNSKAKKDFIHYFITNEKAFAKDFKNLAAEIEPNGMIWVSWKKKTAKAPSAISENQIRETGLSIGLVDIKVCAVDETWSGLKFVIPVKDRK